MTFARSPKPAPCGVAAASRRRFLSYGALSAAALALPGCASMGGFGLTEAIRRLLTLSSQNAFETLLAPGGAYEQRLAGLNLQSVLGARGGVLQSILTSPIVRDRMLGVMYGVAADAAAAAAPIVADTVRTIGIDNAVALVTGEPTAATAFLRGNMGRTLVDAMLPEVGEALRLIDDPVVGPALSTLAGVDLSGVARTLTQEVENSIWNQIGREEAAIRANPRATNDPVLIGVFGPQ